jgi:hypothetical protein
VAREEEEEEGGGRPRLERVRERSEAEMSPSELESIRLKASRNCWIWGGEKSVYRGVDGRRG